MKELTAKRFDWFFEKHFGIGVRWDDWLYPLHLSIAFPFVTIAIGIGKFRESGEVLPNITGTPCLCPKCGWDGTVWDCEGDVDGDGNLGCPECLTVVKVTGGPF